MSELAVNTLADRAPPGIGHNAPPLAEQLAEEIAADKARADELIAVAETARIANDADAEKVTTLVALIRGHEKKLDGDRDARKRPFLESCRVVDAAYGAVIRPLALVRAGTDGRGGLGAMLTAWQRKREEEARIERERIDAERRRREAEAEAARVAAEEARAKGSGSVAAELEALHKAEEAEALARQAETIRPEPIRSPLGAVSSRREIAFEITDLRKLLSWMLKQPMKGGVEQAARTIMGNYLRQLGVETIARGIDIPGLSARVESRAQVR